MGNGEWGVGSGKWRMRCNHPSFSIFRLSLLAQHSRMQWQMTNGKWKMENENASKSLPDCLSYPHSPFPTPYSRCFSLISNNFGQYLPVTKRRSEASS
jgi:hypothetical protein